VPVAAAETPASVSRQQMELPAITKLLANWKTGSPNSLNAPGNMTNKAVYNLYGFLSQGYVADIDVDVILLQYIGGSRGYPNRACSHF